MGVAQLKRNRIAFERRVVTAVHPSIERARQVLEHSRQREAAAPPRDVSASSCDDFRETRAQFEERRERMLQAEHEHRMSHQVDFEPTQSQLRRAAAAYWEARIAAEVDALDEAIAEDHKQYDEQIGKHFRDLEQEIDALRAEQRADRAEIAKLRGQIDGTITPLRGADADAA